MSPHFIVLRPNQGQVIHTVYELSLKTRFTFTHVFIAIQESKVFDVSVPIPE